MLRELGYPDSEDVAAEFVDKENLAREVLEELLNVVLSRKYFPLALGRYVLRRAASLRCRSVLPRLVENAVRFIPVLRDLILYFVKIAHVRNHDSIGATLEYLITRSDWRSFPFVQYWVLTAIQQVPEFANAEKAMAWSSHSDSSIRDRMLALSALAYGLTDWVREKKETWSNTSVWAQRANVWAAAVLPREERGHWLRPIRNNPDQSVKAVADALWIIAESKPETI